MFLSRWCHGINLEMVLPWMRVGFECCDDNRIPYMEKIYAACVVSCDVRDIGMWLKKIERGGGTRCVEGLNIGSQS